MTRIIYCQKLKKEGEGLEYLPYKGELGQRIYDNISKEVWDKWMNYQTMLINEYRLNLAEKEARDFIKQETESFLFKE